MPVQTCGAYAGDKLLESMEITRCAPGPQDVQIDIATLSAEAGKYR
jgi:Na+-translocating ferredoxin:NAD+ oxidoreductase RNF subunit RnfB